MNRAILKRRIRDILVETLTADSVETHRCVDGKVVPMDTPRCVKDLEYRIEDAAADRDACVTRTDARVHYNGLLNVLRRKLRYARKLQPDI